MGSLKNALKKILPPPVNSFMREVNRIAEMEEKNQELTNQVLNKLSQQELILNEHSIKLKQQEERIELCNEMFKNYFSTLEAHERKINDTYAMLLSSMDNQFANASKQIEQLKLSIDTQFVAEGKQIEQLKASQQCALNRLDGIKQENNKLKAQLTQLDKSIIKQMPQPILEYFVLNILDHCNLRCKGCDHFAAIAEKRFVALEDIERDLAKMSELLDGKLIRMGIMGGEPLLHPDLLAILKLARKHFPNTLLQLVTNGLLLMNQPEEFWITCRDNNIVIVNTKYPINLDYDGMQERAKQYGVTFEHYGNTGTVQKTSYKMVMDEEGRQNARNSFLKCYHANALPLLMEGKFYSCTVAPNVRHFNKKFGTDMQLTEEDYLDIYKISNSQEIFEFLSKPISFCRYCDVEHRQYGLEWERSKQVKEEWVNI